MARTVIVGDVHGCRAELEDLLAKIGFTEDDRLYFVGDLVARGPDSARVLLLAKELNAHIVRGNHEEKILRWKAAHDAGHDSDSLSEVHRKVVSSMGTKHWGIIEKSPLWLDLPEHDLRIVHAGVVPGVAIEKLDRRVILNIRTLDDRGQAQERATGVLWGGRYRGSPHLVFGHFARRDPQLHPDATGLDTACVYGGALTALVLPANSPVPAIKDRSDALFSVPARRTWFLGTRREPS